MSDQFNWVEKQHMATKHLADSKPGLWRDICAALTDASRSFNKLYGGRSDVTTINGHRFRVVLHSDDHKFEADIDFDDQAPTVRVSYDASICDVKTFDMKADYVSAFIVDENGKRMTIDEVSHMILKPLFFAGPQTSTHVEIW